MPYYQPETALQIFNRVMFNMDVATGKTATTADYSSIGPSSAWTPSGPAPHEDPARCYIWDIFETCTPDEQRIIGNGSAITENFILVGQLHQDGSQVFFNGTSGTGQPASGNSQSAASLSLTLGWKHLSATFGLSLALILV